MQVKHLKRGTIYNVLGVATVRGGMHIYDDAPIIIFKNEKGIFVTDFRCQAPSFDSEFVYFGRAQTEVTQVYGDQMVVYQDVKDLKVYARAEAEFWDGRFEGVASQPDKSPAAVVEGLQTVCATYMGYIYSNDQEEVWPEKAEELVSRVQVHAILTELTTQVNKLVNAMQEAKGCFDAAFTEGLHERIQEATEKGENYLGSLPELMQRRILYAYETLRDTLAQLPESGPRKPT